MLQNAISAWIVRTFTILQNDNTMSINLTYPSTSRRTSSGWVSNASNFLSQNIRKQVLTFWLSMGLEATEVLFNLDSVNEFPDFKLWSSARSAQRAVYTEPSSSYCNCWDVSVNQLLRIDFIIYLVWSLRFLSVSVRNGSRVGA